MNVWRKREKRLKQGSGYWQPAVTSESSLETAGCLQRTFAGDSQQKYIDGILTIIK